jgi:hypothetical protein
MFIAPFPNKSRLHLNQSAKCVWNVWAITLCLLLFSLPECVCLPVFPFPWVGWCKSYLLNSTLSLDSSSLETNYWWHHHVHDIYLQLSCDTNPHFYVKLVPMDLLTRWHLILCWIQVFAEMTNEQRKLIVSCQLANWT